MRRPRLDRGQRSHSLYDDNPKTERLGDDRQVLELIQRLQKQTERLQDNVKELRHQQDKASAAQSQVVKTLDSVGQRVEALEEAVVSANTCDTQDRVFTVSRPQEDQRYVTWEAMKSALITERQIIQKDLIQTIKEEDVVKTEPSISAISDSSQTQTKESRKEEKEAKDSNVKPGLAVSDPSTAPVPPLKSLSEEACTSSMNQMNEETVEALRNIGRLQQRCDLLEERLTALDQERNRETKSCRDSKNSSNREIDDNSFGVKFSRGRTPDPPLFESDEAFDAVKEQLEEQRAKVQILLSERDKSVSSEVKDSDVKQRHADTGPEQRQTDPRLEQRQTDPGLQQRQTDPGIEQVQRDVMELRRGFNHLSSQTLKTNRSILPSVLALTHRQEKRERERRREGEKGEGGRERERKGEGGRERHTHREREIERRRDREGGRGRKKEWRKREMHRQEREEREKGEGEESGRERGRSAQLVSGVQQAIDQLQAECEKLHEDNQQKQTHIEELYKTTEELEEKKADKNMVETEIRADKSALDSKVSRVQFDSVTEQLSNMFNDLLNKVTDQEQDWSKLMEKLSSEMDCKLNRIELDSVKKQLEARWKTIQERMKNEGAPEQDDAAGIRKQLVERFHCLSCDRPVIKQTPGPQLLTLPASPGFQPHRSLRPFTVYTLEQIRQHCRSERVLEVADYSLYSVSRSCGGSHTLTSFNQRQRSAHQQNSQQGRMLAQLDDTLGQSEEVDIVGLDGHIYKGRLNSSLSRHAETKLPTIASRDGSSRSRSRPRSSPSPRDSAPSPGLQRPSPCPPSGSCSSGRDWPVSPLGCPSQSSVVPMSVNAAAGSPT
ncbi:hypothetical protein WMY93_002072 [Mugilogobius chulae]|uniref:DUF4795 domain-containing protein n=1 Tax=Mugilogobius chulae TaxID=88201 RepID=A0AAW0PYK3_9GOBI